MKIPRGVITAAQIAAAAAAIYIAEAHAAQMPEKPPSEADDSAPIDTGEQPFGLAPLAPLAVSPDAYTKGVFDPVQTWPIIAIHAALLPDGRVISFGTGTGGNQNGLAFDIWTPGTTDHLTLPNTTGSDVFCAGQTVLSDGRMLTVGGDLTINGQRNWSNDTSTLFTPATNSVASGPHMTYARWYPTVVSLVNGEQLVVGGREEGPAPDVTVPTITPEVFNSSTGWRTLTTAASDAAFGLTRNNWYYPRAWLTPRGNVLVWGNEGVLYSVAATGTGLITTISGVTTKASAYGMPAVMYRPGKLLSLRNNGVAATVDATINPPATGVIAPAGDNRIWSTLTVLADGNLLLTGGSGVANQLTNVSYTANTYHVSTNTWTVGASMTKARLYHSTTLLLPDATVLVAGGGAPGPVKQLNAEVYHPGYLYTSTGQPAVRPTISGAPQALIAGQTFSVTVGATDAIGRMALIRTGADTHSFDSGQRFVALGFTQSGATVTATVPANANVIPPGYYMLFVVKKSGVPSVAKIVHLG